MNKVREGQEQDPIYFEPEHAGDNHYWTLRVLVEHRKEEPHALTALEIWRSQTPARHLKSSVRNALRQLAARRKDRNGRELAALVSHVNRTGDGRYFLTGEGLNFYNRLLRLRQNQGSLI